MDAGSLTIFEIMRRMARAGQRATLLGIGPLSRLVVRASFEVAAEEGFPPCFIASRNQVDSAELGGGYVLGGMDAEGLMRFLAQEADAVGYSGPWFVCRDHGGPWQRNEELAAKLPVDEALARARRSFAADIAAGFRYLHIDPTKCPLPHSDEDLIAWTVDLIAFCESMRRQLGKPAIDYEIGTDDIKGGDTSAVRFRSFLREVLSRIKAQNLPAPVCVVGQTGTLTRMDYNEGGFHRATARQLVAIARENSVDFKEHNADYLDDDSLLLHPEIGIGAANVAPEFGYVETSSLLTCAEYETAALARGWQPVAEKSDFADRLAAAVQQHAPWRKWLPYSLANASTDDLFGDRHMARRLTAVCGHYVYDLPEIKAGRTALMANIAALWGTKDPERFVRQRIGDAIRRYVRPFGLRGLNILLAS